MSWRRPCALRYACTCPPPRHGGGLTQALGLIVNWLNDIKKLGIEPPQSNNLSIVIDLPPVSLQATGESKRAFIRKVREQCSCYSFLLTSDVQIEVTWHIHEQERYETDRSPDVDNILKPLLDGLCGPEGILIDDNQVQSISCSWVDWTARDEALTIEIRFLGDDWVPKGHFQFIQFDRGLCYPVATVFPIDLQKSIVSAFERGLIARKELEKLGASYENSRSAMPIGRIFHRTRIGQFPITTLEAFKGSLGEP